MAAIERRAARAIVRRLPAIALLAPLVGWSALLLLLAFREPEGTDDRLLAFGVLLSVATVVAAMSVFVASGAAQAITAATAGMAVLLIGIFGGGTVGLPLVPVGMILLIMALVTADGTDTPRQTMLACAAAASVAAGLLVAVALLL
jgi:hypothetical protein